MSLRIDILTLFPELFEPFANTSIVGRAVKNNIVDIEATNFRDFATDKYGSVDDCPYGGGPGMVLKCHNIYSAVEHVRDKIKDPPGKVVMMTPQGRPLTQELCHELTQEPRLIILTGHYEGFDERIRTGLVDMEISLGDFVLSGGEIPAMALVDSVVRLLPGALGKDESTHEESFQNCLLEYPQYTRPQEYRGMTVPDVLLSGNHAKIEAWRLEQAELRTKQRRPDLWEEYLKIKQNQS